MKKYFIRYQYTREKCGIRLDALMPIVMEIDPVKIYGINTLNAVVLAYAKENVNCDIVDLYVTNIQPL